MTEIRAEHNSTAVWKRSVMSAISKLYFIKKNKIDINY